MKRDESIVLVADDNMFIRFLVKKMLGKEAQIVEIGNGADVLSAYEKYQPDLVFLDIHLPGRSGKDVLQDLMLRDPKAFVVMLSADSLRENVVYAMRTGAKSFITKPFTRETLHKYYAKSPGVQRIRARLASQGGSIVTS